MKGQVYLLTSIETGMGYVGSTINLVHRLCVHRNEKYNNCRSKLLGRFTHLILEEVIDDDITDKDEFLILLGLLERKWQDFYWGYLVNKKRSQVTQEEHSEQIKENMAKYYAEHSEYFKEYSTKSHEEHSEKFNCECGGKYIHYHKSRHFKSKKHQNYLNLPPPQSTPDTQ